MRRRVAMWGAAATVVLYTVISVLINQLHGGWPWWVVLTLAVVVSVGLAMWFAAHEHTLDRGDVQQQPARMFVDVGRGGDTASSSSQPPLTVQPTAGADWRAQIDPDRTAVFRPAISGWALITGLITVIWLACLVAVLAGSDWALPEDPELDGRSNNAPLWIMMSLGLPSAAGLSYTGARGLCKWRVQSPFRPGRRVVVPGWQRSIATETEAYTIFVAVYFTFCLGLLLFFWGYFVAALVFGVRRYAEHMPLIALAYALVIVGLPILLASFTRLGYVVAFQEAVDSILLPQQRRLLADGVVRRTLRNFRGDHTETELRYLLDELLAIPAARIFTLADGITAVAVGTRIALISSVSWPPGRYARRASQGVMCNGRPRPDLDAPAHQISEHLRTLTSQLPSRPILRAFIVVTVNDTNGGTVEFENGPGRVLFVRRDKAVTTIGAFLAEQPYRIDSKVALALWRHTGN
ncbi:MAG: hypothetical protein ACRDTH_03470 [Pseudonocardiaceae bacterium]